MRTILLLLLLTVSPCLAADIDPGRYRNREPKIPPIPPPWTRKPLIQVALVLDTGPEMNRLYFQAKTEIRSIVNELIFTEKAGQSPIVQLAVMTDSIVTPFTTQYDAIFGRIDRLQTRPSGAQNRVETIRIALRRLQWSPYPEDLKVLFVVGNDQFTRKLSEQTAMCSEGIAAGVVINTLYCGPRAIGLNRYWAEPAYCTGGQFLAIDHAKRLRLTRAPMDRQLLKLNAQMNDTYRLSADPGRALWKQEKDQDRAVSMVSKEAAFQRILTKAAQGLLMNATDTILNEQSGAWGLEPEVPPPDVPRVTTEKEYQELNEDTRRRRDIQSTILQLFTERRAYLASRPSYDSKRRPTLGQGVIQIIHQQAQAKNFQTVSAMDTNH